MRYRSLVQLARGTGRRSRGALPLLAALVWLFAGLGLVACKKEGKPAEGGAKVGVESGRAAASAEPRIETFEMRSAKLSAFAGEDVVMKAAVLTPKDYDPRQTYPGFYYVHGFGGNAKFAAKRYGERIAARMREGDGPRMIYVFLDGSHPMGHHVFADSANMGPWGTALVEELVPALEDRYALEPSASGRFLGGHSSGGWSSLWIQITHSTEFGGVWSTAPDPVDFRDFTGIDIYTFDNAYVTPAGETVQLMYRDGKPRKSVREYVAHEVATQPTSGQFFSFDAVFSPKSDDGLPRLMFDRETGAIDREVAEAWRAYDISHLLRTQWKVRAATLSGKLHVICGTQDTFGLHRPLRLLEQELRAVGSDALFLFVEGRDHFDLYKPHPELFPDGLRPWIEAQVLATYERSH